MGSSAWALGLRVWGLGFRVLGGDSVRVKCESKGTPTYLGSGLRETPGDPNPDGLGLRV